MLYSSLLLAATAFSGAVSAQSSTSSSSASTAVPTQTPVDPATIDPAQRAGWCNAERNTCPQICGSAGTLDNNCDANTFAYSCTCRDGNQRNISDYAQTLPSFICQASIDACIAQNAGQAVAQANCRRVTCGKRNASEESTSSSSGGSSSSMSGSMTSTSAAPSGSSSARPSGSSSGSAAAPSSSTGAAALLVARDYGTPALVVGLLAVFGFAM